MGQVTLAPIKKLTIFSWGRGIGDLRYFEGNILTAEELEQQKKSYERLPYDCTYLDFLQAIKTIQLTMADAPPGIYFAGNPHYGSYGKWNVALQAAGFSRVPGCAINRVYDTSWTWKNKTGYQGRCYCTACSQTQQAHPWRSLDGYDHWIHAFYYIVPGLKKPVEFDFGKRAKNPTNGDDNNSLWQINYGGRHCGNRSGGDYVPKYCPKFARLSKNCGVAMGQGLPECGKLLDEEFFTIATQADGQKWPKDWDVFLEYGGLRWAHNLRKLDTAQLPCPHKMELG